MRFLDISTNHEDQKVAKSASSSCCDVPNNKGFCIVPYIEVHSQDNLKFDNVISAIGCVRLGWQENIEGNSHLPSKQYSLIPMDSICGLVHIVPTVDRWQPLLAKSEQKQ